jgi:hypothetical protein
MLNTKQLRFVDEYCISHSAADAARKAGYSVKTARSIGHELLTKPDVQEAVQARQATTALELGVTRQQVLSDLLEAIQTARLQGNPGAMIQGARELGKLMGFYSPELVEIHMSTNDAVLKARYEAMSDEELMSVIDGKCETA